MGRDSAKPVLSPTGFEREQKLKLQGAEETKRHSSLDLGGNDVFDFLCEIRTETTVPIAERSIKPSACFST